MNKLNATAFFGLFDPETLKAAAAREGVTHLVLFENQQMDASEYGAASACIVGPGRTFATLDEAFAARLGELPSRFQYPTGYVEASEILA